MLENLHFLRPEWFWAIIPSALILVFLVKHIKQQSGWEDVCDPALLQYQLAQQQPQNSTPKRFIYWFLPIALLITIFSLAGPSWEKKHQPIFQQGNALVLVLDLSLSMNANDIKPSRLERAKLKIVDILQQKKEGQTALIAYGGDAHTVSPLTIDNKTIKSLLPALETSIMPLAGSHINDALLTAEELLINSGYIQGDILLLTDGIDTFKIEQLEDTVKRLNAKGYILSVIGIGSKAGSPIPIPGKGGFIKDSAGQVVLSKLASDPLKVLANMGGGDYHSLSLDDSDFRTLINRRYMGNDPMNEQENQIEQWVDNGVYFSLLIIPFALFAFRKGILSIVFIMFLVPLLFPQTSYAADDLKQFWKDLWSTADQQGQVEFDEQDYEKAAEHFTQDSWKGGAYYRSGNYEKAVDHYSQSDDAQNQYNRGNALAQQQKFQEAIAAYEQAIEQQPDFPDAIQNRDYLKRLLEQQNQMQQQSSQNQDSDQKNQSQQQSSDSKKDDKSQQSQSDQQNQQQSQQQQSKQDQSNQDQKNKQDQQSDSEDKDENKSDQSQSDESKQSKSEQEKQDEQQGQGEQDKEKDKSQSEQDKQQEKSQSVKEKQDKEQSEQDKQDEQQSEQQKQKHQAEQDSESKDQDDKNEPKQPQELLDSKDMQPLENLESERDNQEDQQPDQPNDVLSQLSQEEQQSLKQWLQRIPDNPGELLRLKFRNNSLMKQRQQNAPDQYKGNPW